MVALHIVSSTYVKYYGCILIKSKCIMSCLKLNDYEGILIFTECGRS